MDPKDIVNKILNGDPDAASNSASSHADDMERYQAIIDMADTQKEIDDAKFERQKAIIEQQYKMGQLTAEEYVQRKKINEEMQQSAKHFDDVISTMTGVDSKWRDSTMGRLMSVEGWKALGMSLRRTLTPMNIFGSALSQVQLSTVALMYAQDEALVQFNKQTGASRVLGDEMLNLERNMWLYGVGTAEAREAMVSLNSSMKNFEDLSSTQIQDVSQTTALLDQYGIATQTTAHNMNFLTNAMGASTAQAADFQREMFVLAQDIGMPPEEMAKGFEQAAPHLARFGSQSTEMYKKIAVNAEAANMDVQQLLSITEKFDTFEGAATQVGKLNAMLGGPYLNSLQMVKATDPVERMRLLSEATRNAGMDFDSMGYYQRKALADSMGLKDVSELALVMAGGFDKAVPKVQKSQKELAALAKQTQDFTSLKDELLQMGRAFAIDVLTPIMKGLKTVLQYFQELRQSKGFMWFMNAIRMIGSNLGKVVVVLGIAAGAIALFMGAIGALGAAVGALMAPIRGVLGLFSGGSGEGGAPSGPGLCETLASCAVGVVALGIGFGAAALGASYLVEAFQNMTPGTILAISVAIAALGYSLSKVFESVNTNMGFLAGAGVTLMFLSIGAAAMMMGKGVEMAATGLSDLTANVSLLAVSLSQMFESISQLSATSALNLVATAAALSQVATAINEVDDTAQLSEITKVIQAVNNSANANMTSRLVPSANTLAGANASSLTTAPPTGSPSSAASTSQPLTINLNMGNRQMETWTWDTVGNFLKGKTPRKAS